MRITCIHGYFFFKEDKPGEVSEFMSYYELNLVAKEDYFTFPVLENAPDYSIKGAPLLGNTAIANFEGKPWEVMESNGLIFDLISGTVKPIEQILDQFKISQSGHFFYSDGLINPGSLTESGRKVKGYRGTLSINMLVYRYSEVNYV